MRRARTARTAAKPPQPRCQVMRATGLEEQMAGRRWNRETAAILRPVGAKGSRTAQPRLTPRLR
eukprot:11182479-Lingulodinium_polyedra.AAC.1